MWFQSVPLVALMLLVSCTGEKKKKPPNILFILADDLGWGDVSFHGSPEIPTPNIDALAMSGLTLHHYYGELMCTPSRAALLSGLYPFRLGLQHTIILPGEPAGLPLNLTILPQHMKRLGYDTHMIGKWHMGYMTNNHTPVHRGFDSFLGYYNGLLDYYEHTVYEKTGIVNTPFFFGTDLKNGTESVQGVRGRYATDLFTERAEDIIRQQDPAKPFFLYLAHLAVHAGNSFMPAQAPPEAVARFPHISNIRRRVHAGMLSKLDESVGRLMAALERKGALEETVVVFAGDNGGEVDGVEGGFGANHPLRGKKLTLWEGGLREPAVLWSPLLGLKEPRVATQLMHTTDWLPTLYSIGGGDPGDLAGVDGVDMWAALRDDRPSPRREIVHDVDPLWGVSAMRRGRFKALNGSVDPAFDGWLGPTGREDIHVPLARMDEWVFKDGSEVRRVLQKSGHWIVRDPTRWRRQVALRCGPPPADGDGGCRPRESPCLFDVHADPCEHRNVADQHPEVLSSLMSALGEHLASMPPPQAFPADPRADPNCHGQAHVAWLEPGNLQACTYAADALKG